MSSPRARSPGSPGSKRNRSKDVDFSPKRTRPLDGDFGMTPPPVSQQSRRPSIGMEDVDLTSPKTIKVIGLKADVTAEALWSAFADFGQITAVQV